MATEHDSVALIVERNFFYRKSHHSIVIANLLLLIAIGMLIGFYYYQQSSFAVPQYFPTTPDGVVINSPPDNVNHLLLERLHFNDQGMLLEWPEINASNLDLQAEDSNEHAILLFWASRAIVAMFALDFVNYRDVMQDVRQYFTPTGYTKFLEALNNSKNLDTIKKGKRVAFASLKDKPKVTQVGLLEGHKVWSVEIPIVVTYEGVNQEALTQELLTVVKIARVSTLQTPFYGLAIYQINFKVI
jgi:intracellular multiplication protein IcmL